MLIIPINAIQSCHCDGYQYCVKWGNTIDCAPEYRVDPIVTPIPILPDPKCNNDEIKYYYCEDSNIGSAALLCRPVKEVPEDLSLPKAGWYSSITQDCPLQWNDNNYPRNYNDGGWYYYTSPTRPFYFTSHVKCQSQTLIGYNEVQ